MGWINFIPAILHKSLPAFTRRQSEYEVASRTFGKISILSNNPDDPESIYLMYKQREEIEQAFDAMKNELENDKAGGLFA